MKSRMEGRISLISIVLEKGNSNGMSARIITAIQHTAN